MIQEAIRHYQYGITHDIFKEPVTIYAELAIEALKKLSVYEQVKWERDVAISQLEDIGCGLGRKMEDIKEAIEKQKAKKVINKGQGQEAECMCPNCGKYLGNDADWYYDQTKYCSNCGQAFEEY